MPSSRDLHPAVVAWMGLAADGLAIPMAVSFELRDYSVGMAFAGGALSLLALILQIQKRPDDHRLAALCITGMTIALVFAGWFFGPGGATFPD